MAIQTTGLRYTSEGVDQFIQNVLRASNNLKAFTNSATASSRAIRGAAADLRTHSSSLNAMIASQRAILNANKLSNASFASTSGIFNQIRNSGSGLNTVFSKIGQSVSSIPKSMGSLASSTAKSTASILGFGQAAHTSSLHLDNLLKKVIALEIAYGTVGAIRSWIKTGYEEVILYDQLQSSISTLISRELVETGVAKDMAEAMSLAVPQTKELTEWIEKLGILSIFESGDIKNTVQMALAVGMGVDNAKALTLAVTDWGSVFKATPAQLGQVTHALTDMFTKGRVQSEEMTRQLANHGIPAWQYLAEELGVTTARARDMVFNGLVPAETGIKAIVNGMNKDFGGASARMSTSLVGLTSSLSDLKKISLRELFEPALMAIIPQLERVVAILQTPEVRKQLNDWGEALGRVAVEAFSFAEAMFASGDPIGFIAVQIDKAIPGFYRFAESVRGLGSIFIDIAGEALSWGFNIGASLSEGIVQSMTYIVQALSYIGNIIASWLRPGSPPKLLPDLDEWGRGAAKAYVDGWGLINASEIGGSFAPVESGIFTALNNIGSEQKLSPLGENAINKYLKGWTKGDMDVFSTISKSIKDVLDNLVSAGNLPKEGIIPIILGGKDVLTRAIREIDSFGEVTSDTMSEVDKWASSIGPEMQGIVSSFFEWEEASRAVADAQQELNRINEEFEEQIRGIKDAYDETLDPLQKSLDANEKQQKALRDQERIKKLKETVDSEESTGEERRAAQLEIEEIQIRQQIDAIEERRDAELSAVEEQKQAAVDAATIALEQAQAQEAATKAAFESKQAQIDLQSDQNSLLAEQTRILEQIAKQEEARAKAAAGGGKSKPNLDTPPGPFGGLSLDQGPLKDLDIAMEGLNKRASEARQHWANLRSEFELAKEQAIGIKDSFAPLEPLAAGIGMAFGGIAVGGIITFVARLIGSITPIGALIAAGSLLYQAYSTNFMGVADIANGLFSTLMGGASGIDTAWNTVLLPAMQNVSTFFTTEVIPVFSDIATASIPLVMSAGNLLASLFTNVIVPAASLLWSVFRDVGVPLLTGLVIPVITTLFNVLADYVLPVFKTFYTFLSDTLLPFIKGSIVPLIEAFAKVVGEVLRLAWEAIILIFQTTMKELGKLGESITGVIDYLFGPGSMDAAIASVSSKLNDVIKLVGNFWDGLSRLKSVINDVIRWLNDLAETLSKIHVPDVLNPGSPTPFEIGLRGIAGAIADLVSAIELVPGAFSAMSGVTAEVWKNLDDIDKKAKDLVESLIQSSLSSQIGELGQSLENFRFTNNLYDDVEKSRQAVQDLRDEYAKLISEGKYEEASLVGAQFEGAEALAQQLSDLQNRTDKALSDARDEAVKLMEADPENAQAMYDLRSKHIQDLAELDQKVIMAKTDAERDRLLSERAFIVQQQDFEIQLFERQAQQRADALKSQITEIAQAWSEAWDGLELHGDMPLAVQQLYDLVVALTALKLPEWLTPGSPTPLENAIVGINQAINQLSTIELPVMRMELNRMAAVASPGQIMSSVTNNYTNQNTYQLGVNTNQSPQAVFQSYELMKSIYG